MRYRELGKTGLKVSEIGLGGEWLERHNKEEVRAVIDCCEEQGINILDCWMSEPNVRSNIGAAIRGKRGALDHRRPYRFHLAERPVREDQELDKVKEAFSDLLSRLETDYIDLGMIHFVDETAEFERIISGEFMEYVRELKRKGTIRHIGLSTHNPAVGKAAALSGEIEMILFSVNPAFDLLPADEDMTKYFEESSYTEGLGGIAPEREELYRNLRAEGRGDHGHEGLRRRTLIPGGDFALRRCADAGSVPSLRSDPSGGGQCDGWIRYAGACAGGRIV